MKDLNSYFSLVSANSKFHCNLGDLGGFINFRNSGARGSVKEFTISLESILNGLQDILDNIDQFKNNDKYVEGTWRDLGSTYFKDLVLNSMITVQTKPCFTTFSKIISWANGVDESNYNDNSIDLNIDSLEVTIGKIKKLSSTFSPTEVKVAALNSNQQLSSINNITKEMLSKPFLLLAGISGTGKTRFIREQAKASHELYSQSGNENNNNKNYCLVSVRPDWHEPSDLLGYVSRLGEKPQYIATDTLHFIVQAWKEIIDHIDNNKDNGWWGKPLEQIRPFWLCLDEMNLAPVEQYFSDYLSVLETRSWSGKDALKKSSLVYDYNCEPLLKASVIQSLDENDDKESSNALAKSLGLDLGKSRDKNIWQYFYHNGISIPFNLIVAGTVNMDETTHGFSRKVIDRALSFDFGEFFPNKFDQFITPENQPKILSYPIWSDARQHLSDLPSVDSDGEKSIEFLNSINEILKKTPFELAFRALNELLLAVISIQPKGDLELQAVWDDFLMCKVLPRIEGDSDKLGNEPSVLEDLTGLLQTHFADFWDKQDEDPGARPDLYREKIVNRDEVVRIACRSKVKLEWMQTRLKDSTFTSFWP